MVVRDPKDFRIPFMNMNKGIGGYSRNNSINFLVYKTKEVANESLLGKISALPQQKGCDCAVLPDCTATTSHLIELHY
jgi:hypothetical protein